jgi:hypothetical protein
MITLVCIVCEKSFKVSDYRKETAKYCSRKCKDKNCTIQIKANCQVCQKEFHHISSRCNKAKYCSRLCYHRSQKWRGSKEFKCIKCNKKFMSSPSRGCKFCTIKCRGEYQRKTETYASFVNVRKAMKRRGLIEKCEKCGYNEVKDILGIHHKDENRKNNKIENLMIVCPTCHSLIHRKHIPH